MPRELLLIAVAVYALMSLVTVVAYGWDKRAAVRGQWRTREHTLHMLELLGGFPGAFLGQRLFRHKTRKLRFLAVTWLIATAHIVAWGLLLYRFGVA
jgi:uncharacterized membrane protein YsdA (DUF1294 family)